MILIKIKYIAPANIKGARLVASDGNKNRVYVPYRHEFSRDARYMNAAQKLCDVMGWPTDNLLLTEFGTDMFVAVMFPSDL